MLLEFTRFSQAFRNSFRKCPALNICCEKLEARGFTWELPGSHAKVFVDPVDFADVAVIAPLHKLRPFHVIAAAGFVALVKQVIEELPKREKVKLRQSSPFIIVHPECEEEATSSPESLESPCDSFPMKVVRTFVHVPVPSSLCSTITSGPNTV